MPNKQGQIQGDTKSWTEMKVADLKTFLATATLKELPNGSNNLFKIVDGLKW